jgi:hypothetical protein
MASEISSAMQCYRPVKPPAMVLSRAGVVFMATPDGNIVELMLVTGDDALAKEFAAELEARDTRNPVQHFPTPQACIDHLGPTQGNPAGRSSQIIILDLREDPREGARFLNELHKLKPYKEPVLFLLGAGDHEAEILRRHGRFIAGQLPETGAGAAFVEWAVSMLSSNWSFERTLNDT